MIVHCQSCMHEAVFIVESGPDPLHFCAGCAVEQGHVIPMFQVRPIPVTPMPRPATDVTVASMGATVQSLMDTIQRALPLGVSMKDAIAAFAGEVEDPSDDGYVSTEPCRCGSGICAECAPF